MNSMREVPMLRSSILGFALAAAVATGGCQLDVTNPNAPDANRAFGDPAGLQQLLGGAFRTWVEARDGYYVMPLTTTANNYTASWNNASIRFYSSVAEQNPVLPAGRAASPPFNSRTEMRAAALQKFEAAYATAAVYPTWKTEKEWMGVDGGVAYTNVQIRQLIRTMEAELIAMWPRNSTENAAADWASVKNYASQGVSSGAPFNWQFNIDISARDAGIEYVKSWGNSILTMRVDTRVAALITTNHVDPWPLGGNPCPTTSPDLRVGNGGYGTHHKPDFGTVAADAASGTDYACSTAAIFPAARGQYHQ